MLKKGGHNRPNKFEDTDDTMKNTKGVPFNHPLEFRRKV